MRLLAASLFAGGCLLGAASASAEPLKLDDATLDEVTAGVFRPGTVEERRNFLIADAARQIADGIDGTDNPTLDAARDFLVNLANDLDPPPPPANGNGGGGGGNGIPPIPPIPPINLF